MALQFTLNRDPAASADFDCVVVGAFADKALTPAGQAIDAASGGQEEFLGAAAGETGQPAQRAGDETGAGDAGAGNTRARGQT